MVRQLLERASLEFLKKEAKELLVRIKSQDAEASAQFQAAFPDADPNLAKAQLLLARDYGFSSWTALKRAVDKEDPAFEFVRFALGGQLRQALQLRKVHNLSNDPAANAMTGEKEAVLQAVARDKGLLNEPVAPLNRPLLTYVCMSRLIADKRFSKNIRATAQALLDAGADPNCSFTMTWGGEDWKATALYGAAGVLNDPELTKMLLKTGADPDEGDAASPLYRAEALYHACDFPGHNECLRLLLEANPAQKSKDYCLKRKLDYEDIEGARLFLDHGANPNATDRPALTHAIMRERGLEILQLLLDRGADPNQKDKDGISAYAFARRTGNKEVAGLLEARGANKSLEPLDALLAAAADGDAPRAKELAATHPNLLNEIKIDGEGGPLHDFARLGNVKGLEILIGLGMNPSQQNGWFQTPLHWGGITGRKDVVELLLKRGANFNVADKHYNGTPLGWAIWGSVNWKRPNADYAGAVEAFLDAGAIRVNAGWGSPEVKAVLLAHQK
jgi:ankyrin repeat protein